MVAIPDTSDTASSWSRKLQEERTKERRDAMRRSHSFAPRAYRVPATEPPVSPNPAPMATTLMRSLSFSRAPTEAKPLPPPSPSPVESAAATVMPSLSFSRAPKNEPLPPPSPSPVAATLMRSLSFSRGSTDKPASPPSPGPTTVARSRSFSRAPRRPSRAEARRIFTLLDKDGSGFIDLEELQAGLAKGGKAASLAECRQILSKVAAESDGGRTGVHAVAVRISFEEFAAVLATAPPDALPAGLQTLADASQSVLRGLAELPSEVSGQ